MVSIPVPANAVPLWISVQSRECSTAVLDRLAGSTLFPERPVGAAIIGALHRVDGSVICVTAPAMVDVEEQIHYFARLGMATTTFSDPRPVSERVTLLSIDDRSTRWLSDKLLDADNPDARAAREYLHAVVAREHAAGRPVLLSYFEPSAPLERLAAQLGTLTEQAPAWAISLGTKSASRELFESIGVPVARATPLVHDIADLAAALVPLVGAGHRRFVVKLDSTAYAAGMGNALLELPDDIAERPSAIAEYLPTARVVDAKLDWAGFSALVPEAGVLAEELLTGDEFASPSFQGRFSPDGPYTVSTHEQVLAPNGQTYTGSQFPAAESYRGVITDIGLRVGAALAARGLDHGDYGADFVVVLRAGRWEIFGCEVNLRSTGTRHGFDMARELLGVTPDADGEFRVGDERRVYISSDGIESRRYVGLRPRALIDAVERSPLHYDPARRVGVALHLLSTLVDYGKFGAVCIAESVPAAQRMLDDLRALATDLADHRNTMAGRV